MSTGIDDTHDPALRSWVIGAEDPATPFPIQNLPFGRFRVPGQPGWRIGVAIGDQVLDLRRAGLVDHDDMNRLMALGGEGRRELRQRLSRGLRIGSGQRDSWAGALFPQKDVSLGLPCRIGDYTDFYTSIHHATSVGRQFRPDNPLLPNYKWVPIGYHGRASSIVPGNQAVRRPRGQVKGAAEDRPVLRPSARLDYELELAAFVGRGNALGEAIPVDEADEHLFGLALLNDWSARDVQSWEYQPLGPFLSKNFASTISPWIVTIEALAPFRTALARPAGDPEPLPYLNSPRTMEAGAFSIQLEVWLQTERMRRQRHAGDRLSRVDFAQAAYWTLSQLVAHHTINGCNLQTGDMLGTGTLSGPERDQAGSLLELTTGGSQPLTLSSGEQRSFVEDGDAIRLRGWCERSGFRSIGFGDCTALVLPSNVR